MSKRFLLILAAIIAGLGLIFWLGSDNNGSSGGNTKPTNHIMGQGKKGVILIEYGDYQCPICEQYYPVLKEVSKKFKKDIFFQFRNLPLFQIHQNAFAGARAAEAAGLQNKFWEMHDLLYENQQSWSSGANPMPAFEAYAQQLGLDLVKFRSDYASSTVNNLINADIKAFDKTGNEHATPTFFLNGQKIANKPDVGYFADQIEKAINKK